MFVMSVARGLIAADAHDAHDVCRPEMQFSVRGNAVAFAGQPINPKP